MNIIKMFMNNVIIPFLAVRICKDSDNRGSDKRGVSEYLGHCILNNIKILKFLADWILFNTKLIL